VQKTRNQFNYFLLIKKNKHHLYSDNSEDIDVLNFPHAVSQSFLFVFPYISEGTMATGQTCCHLPGEMLNLAAKAADRARIYFQYVTKNCFSVAKANPTSKLELEKNM
jgi:hypothetical protein